MRQLPVVLPSDYEREVAACIAFLRTTLRDDCIDRARFNAFRADDDLFYARYPQVGSAGLLMERATGQIWDLGGAYSLETYLWAYDRGFRYDQGATVTITHVRDIDATLAVLRRAFHAPYVRAELLPRLSRPPVAIDLTAQQCWMSLRELQTTQAFDFEVS